MEIRDLLRASHLLRRVRVFNGGLHIEIPTPAVLKPRKLFTGAQLVPDRSSISPVTSLVAES